MTREGLAYATGKKEATICGRVNELIKAGILTPLGELGTTSSGRHAELLTINVSTKNLYSNDPHFSSEIVVKSLEKNELSPQLNNDHRHPLGGVGLNRG